MGCDIHLTIEERRDGEWREVETPSDYDHGWRCYREFAVLANVRNWKRDPVTDRADYNSQLLKPIAMPRGLPPEPQWNWLREEIAKGPHDSSYGDDHSHTWLTLRELYEWDWSEYRSEPSGWYDSEPYLVRFCKKHWPDATDDMRLVFWFDN